MDKRKRYTAGEKVKILSEVLEDGKHISQVAEQYELHPNNIFNWRKQLFKGGIQTFHIKRTDISGKAGERKIAAMEDKIKQKDEVIAELAEELLGLKKRTWPTVGKMKMSLEIREIAKKEITLLRGKTEIPLETLLRYAGVSQRTWYEWARRQRRRSAALTSPKRCTSNGT